MEHENLKRTAGPVVDLTGGNRNDEIRVCILRSVVLSFHQYCFIELHP